MKNEPMHHVFNKSPGKPADEWQGQIKKKGMIVKGFKI